MFPPSRMAYTCIEWFWEPDEWDPYTQNPGYLKPPLNILRSFSTQVDFQYFWFSRTCFRRSHGEYKNTQTLLRLSIIIVAFEHKIRHTWYLLINAEICVQVLYKRFSLKVRRNQVRQILCVPSNNMQDHFPQIWHKHYFLVIYINNLYIFYKCD